jgi:hypothetical protein
MGGLPSVGPWREPMHAGGGKVSDPTGEHQDVPFGALNGHSARGRRQPARGRGGWGESHGPGGSEETSEGRAKDTLTGLNGEECLETAGRAAMNRAGTSAARP